MARVGIVGTGWGSRVQIPAFREGGLEVAGIAGRDPARTRKIARELDVEAFDDWRSLVTSGSLDLISIVTPPSEHLQMAIAALQAGKHVLCEKPTALNASEAEQLLAVATQHPHSIALIDHELRFLPSFLAARTRAPELGSLRYAEVRYSSPARGDSSREWNWWSDAAQGGGIWGAVGSHFADALRYLIGDIVTVRASLQTFIRERPYGGGSRPVTVDDFAVVEARFRDGVVAAMTLSAVSAGPDEQATLTLHGEQGAMRLLGEELLFAKPGAAFERVAGDDLSEKAGNSRGGAFGTGTVHLARAVRKAIDDGDEKALAPAATFADGLAQQRILDAARTSSIDGGRWVNVEGWRAR